MEVVELVGEVTAVEAEEVAEIEVAAVESGDGS